MYIGKVLYYNYIHVLLIQGKTFIHVYDSQAYRVKIAQLTMWYALYRKDTIPCAYYIKQRIYIPR
jgi:hypothetical protein